MNFITAHAVCPIHVIPRPKITKIVHLGPLVSFWLSPPPAHMSPFPQSTSSLLLLLLFSLQAHAQSSSGNVTTIPTDIVGTWSTGTGDVLTGPGFCDPVTSTFKIPASTGRSYTFSANGYFEEAIYTITSNASSPGCLTTALIWQHGKLSMDLSNNINFLPEAADGRVNVTNPCTNLTQGSSLQYYYQPGRLTVCDYPCNGGLENRAGLRKNYTNTPVAVSSPPRLTDLCTLLTEKFAGYATSTSSTGKAVLQLARFDGAPLEPLYLVNRTPIMLATGVISNGLVVSGGTSMVRGVGLGLGKVHPPYHTMSENPPPSSRSAAEQFLQSIGDITSAPVATESTDPDAAAKPAADAKEILSFLDEITNTASTTTTTTPIVDNVVVSSTTVPAPPLSPSSTAAAAATAAAGAWVSWGNSLWSQASQAVKTTTEQIAKTAADPETARRLEEKVKGLGNLVNTENINKISHDIRNLTISSVSTILETVAPAIAEHEIVEVWLAHDMVGYVGVEALVYRAFAKVMEQTEAGEVVVRKGNSANGENAATVEKGDEERDLNICEGIEEGVKLAKANIDHLIKSHQIKPTPEPTSPTAAKLPVTTCPVFMSIQPCRAMLGGGTGPGSHFLYVILLSDPTYDLHQTTFSQSMPASWLDVPYEENEWVEDRMVEAIRLGVQIVAQEYVWTRMKGVEKRKGKGTEGEVKVEKE
ncbi:hypothetical protein BC936DRAFT_139274 [Jimgerdemannia flammicorona]|uniref:Uncharacterized protein n=1 Tax=Jimgerdemannia flammicorona TaxID=994334 RepID=A0A433BA89_9FUNG|nr:hypothetical protein BC936DRAFT_139274 [Jimgerdemannia flammicorona]